MKKLFIILCVLLLSSPVTAALIGQQPRPGENVVYDDINNMMWYPYLDQFINMTYSEQLNAISAINTSTYGGSSEWHMPLESELVKLVTELDTPAEAPLFNPSATHPDDMWFGRFDFYGGNPTYPHSAGGYVINNSGQVEWNGGGIKDSESLDWLGAWVVSDASSPVPEPATMLLLGSGLVGLAGFGRKKFKK